MRTKDLNNQSHWNTKWMAEGKDTWRKYHKINAQELEFISNNSKLIDLGCGNGYFLGQVKEKKNNMVLMGLDISSVGIAQLNEFYGIPGMEKRVLFFHTVDPLKIHEIYNWGDVFITMPNSDMMFTEQIGFTVPQALASGLPVITYDYGGQSEFIDSKVGFKAQYKNYRQAGQKLRELFTDENLLKEMSNNARNKAVGHFSSDLFAKEIKSYYSSLL